MTQKEELAKRFGENLARARRRARLSQEELAFRAGLHRTEIGLLENARRVPRIDTLVKLCSSLEVGVDELLDGINWNVVAQQDEGAMVVSPRLPKITATS